MRSDEAKARIGTLTAVLGLLFAATMAGAEHGVDTTTTDHPLIAPVRAPAPPVLDGILDDAAWKVAPQLDDFYVPNLDRYPTERTILWLAYDDSCIYWAGRMYDREPGSVRMDQTRRGGDVMSDDYISIGFDVDNQHVTGGEIVFRVTPRGTQSEDFPDGAAAKVEWRGDWRAVARIDSLGWTVEVAIPMRIFNRPGGPRVVGISSARRVPRTQERVLWPNLGATWDRTKLGDWNGVVFPAQRQRPRIMPYAVGEGTFDRLHGTSSDSVGGRRIRSDGSLGVDAKWTSPSGIKLVGTVHPDFQNVENEILGLDFSYTERLRGDNRPFFAENRGYLPKSWMFYTNRIGEVYGGAKAVGEVGENHRFGIIETYDRRKTNHMAGQWYWQPANRFGITNGFVWRHGPPGSVTKRDTPQARDNLMVVSDAVKTRMGRRGTDTFTLQGGLARTSGLPTGWDLEASWDRNPANANFGGLIQVRLISKDFITIDGGFQTEEADLRDISGRIGYEREHDRRYLKDWGLWLDFQRATRFDDALYQGVLSLSSDVTLYPGIVLGTYIEDTHRPPYHDRTATETFGWLQDRLFTAGQVGATYGRVEDADYLLVWIEQAFRPVRALTSSVRAQYRRRDFPIGHPSDSTGGVERQYQLVGTMQYDLTTERAISGRVISTHDGVNGYATFQQVVRRGMDLYLIIGDPSADTWTGRVALKAVFVL